MPTYKLIASSTVGSGGASSITFSSIPGTYTDLVVKLSGRSATNGDQDYIKILLNSDAVTNYSYRRLYGNGGTAASDSATGFSVNAFTAGNTNTANTFGNAEIYIPNYTTTGVKSISTDGVNENNGTTAYAGLSAVSSVSGSAVTTLTITTGSGSNWLQYSSATLYGISNA